MTTAWKPLVPNPLQADSLLSSSPGAKAAFESVAPVGALSTRLEREVRQIASGQPATVSMQPAASTQWQPEERWSNPNERLSDDERLQAYRTLIDQSRTHKFDDGAFVALHLPSGRTCVAVTPKEAVEGLQVDPAEKVFLHRIGGPAPRAAAVATSVPTGSSGGGHHAAALAGMLGRS